VALLQVVVLDGLVKRAMMRRRKTKPLSEFLLGTLFLGMLGALQGCNSSATPTSDVSSRVTPKAVAASAPPAAAEQDEPYIASGPIVVENQLDVLAQREGMLSEIFADVGEVVHKGQLLARLDDRQLAAQRDATEAKVHSCEADLQDWEAEAKVAESDLKRAEQMRDAGINTQEALDHARYKYAGSQYEIEKSKRELENAQATLRDFQLELQKTRIEAPFDGVVARRYVRAGQRVASGDRLFWVSAVAPLLVKFTLPERFMGKVKNGDEVYVNSTAAPETQHLAKVVQISPVVDPASDSIDVMAKLEGKPAELRPGMTASVRLVAAPSKSQ
jgi:membrane fusion protein, multidrug efflux system